MPEQQLVEIAKAIGARRQDPDHGRADGVADRARGRAAVRRHRAPARRRASASSTSRTGSRRSSSIADRVTVLRDGETVATRDRAELDRATLIRLMVGRELSAVFPKRSVTARRRRARAARRVEPCRRRARRLVVGAARRDPRDSPASSDRAGHELAETIFGLTPADAGEILVGGSPRTHRARRRDAIAAGIGYVPEDRRRHGVVLDMPIAANTSLANLRGGVAARADRPRARNARRPSATSIASASRRRRSSPRSGRSPAATSRRWRWRAGSRPTRPC